MNNDSDTMGRRQYANLCRDFITASKDIFRDTFRDQENEQHKTVSVLRRLGFAMCDATPFVFEDELINLSLRKISEKREFLRACLLARQERINIIFANNMTRHILRCGAYTVPDLTAVLPEGFRSAPALAYTEKKKLGGLHLLLTDRTLMPR
jgi:hypothetical protein